MRTWAPAASGFAAPSAPCALAEALADGALGRTADPALVAGATLADGAALAAGGGGALGADALGAGWARSDAAIVSDIVANASDTTTLFRACIEPC